MDSIPFKNSEKMCKNSEKCPRALRKCTGNVRVLCSLLLLPAVATSALKQNFQAVEELAEGSKIVSLVALAYRCPAHETNLTNQSAFLNRC